MICLKERFFWHGSNLVQNQCLPDINIFLCSQDVKGDLLFENVSNEQRIQFRNQTHSLMINVGRIDTTSCTNKASFDLSLIIFYFLSFLKCIIPRLIFSFIDKHSVKMVDFFFFFFFQKCYK